MIKVVFMGILDFLVLVFCRFIEDGYEVVGVVM